MALDPFADFYTLKTAPDIDSALYDLMTFDVCRRRLEPPIGDGSRDYAEDFFSSCVEDLEDCLLVLDEITLWSGPVASKALETLVLQGRRLGIRIIVACQRISLVPGVILAEATDIVLFHMSRPRDLKVAAEWSDKETASRLRALEIGQCFHCIT